MQIKNITFSLNIYQSINDLSANDSNLVSIAQKATQYAYAPYSSFKVGAAAILTSGQVIIGSNQENASYGATICAERVLLANYSCLEEVQLKIMTIAVSYKSHNMDSCTPVTPCGICRQVLTEYETKQGDKIRLLLSGQSGEVWEIASVSDILPLGFNKTNLLIS